MRAVSLPMYDLPFLRVLTDAWMAGLARALIHEGFADASQVWAGDVEALWRSPELLLSQSCGYPLMTDFAGTLVPLATPVYRAAGCAGTDYLSFIIVREDAAANALADLRGLICTVNDWRSHSGMNALRHAVAPLARNGKFFGAVSASGSHLNSLRLVAGGAADVAAVDNVTHALAALHAPALLEGLRILATTRTAPALPYVTRSDLPLAPLAAALHRAAADPDLTAVRDDLLIEGFVELPVSAYAPMLAMETEAANLAYPTLA